MGFDVAGRDTAAQLLVIELVPGAAPAVIGSAPVRLDGAPAHVTLAGPVVPAGAAREYVVAVQLGAGVANGTRFSATWRPEDLTTRGTLSGEEHRSGAASPVASPVRPTTVLADGETVNLSENPVRTPPLVINYAERPRAIYVYSVAGARVRTISGSQLENGRALWALDNDRGEALASGVYLLVLDAVSGPIVRKIFLRR